MIDWLWPSADRRLSKGSGLKETLVRAAPMSRTELHLDARGGVLLKYVLTLLIHAHT